MSGRGLPYPRLEGGVPRSVRPCRAAIRMSRVLLPPQGPRTTSPASARYEMPTQFRSSQNPSAWHIAPPTSRIRTAVGSTPRGGAHRDREPCVPWCVHAGAGAGAGSGGLTMVGLSLEGEGSIQKSDTMCTENRGLFY